MREGKPVKITFQEEGMWAKKVLSVYLCRYKPVPFSVYVYTCVATQCLFFAYTVCNWLACTAMPRLDIDTRRVVFLKSTAGYSVHKL